ncbi:leucine-rich repeat protein [Acinetobacter sp. YH12063]|uniref:leucine-rich repeat protein n=1 Tax=Acinetobacter sp. YH12063 TaxID=2601061 RepID=UPI0015D16AB2|nr:leucine-rich repeat protein [Acinetobacter sp. YH12063]
MATYTGVADANGDFTVPFSSSYTSGQKVTVTAEKDSATKTIELYAPTDVIPQINNFQFSGTMVDFPQNIGVITLNGLSGRINDNAMNVAGTGSIPSAAQGLVISDGPTIVGYNAFGSWSAAQSLVVGDTIETIEVIAFANWTNAKTVVIGQAVSSIGSMAFTDLTQCNTITVKANTPPTIEANTFAYLKGTCIIKVPAASVAAYKAANVWKTFGSRIQAI